MAAHENPSPRSADVETYDPRVHQYLTGRTLPRCRPNLQTSHPREEWNPYRKRSAIVHSPSLCLALKHPPLKSSYVSWAFIRAAPVFGFILCFPNYPPAYHHEPSRLISSTYSHCASDYYSPGGGFFTIAGAAAGSAPVAVAAGTAITAGSNQPEKPDDPERPPTSVPDEQPSSAPPSSRPATSTEAPTSTSSAVPSGSPAPHVAYPRDDATDQDKKNFLALVDKEIGKGQYRETSDAQFLFIAANMTTAQRDALAKSPLVGGVEPDQQYQNNVGASVLIADRDLDDEVHEKWWMESLDKLGRIRKRAVVKQDKAPTELVMFSQPPLVDLEALTSYTYDESAGEEITVYVLDEGYYTKNSAQMDTQEYTGMTIKPRWIFGGAQAETSVEEDVDPGGHGSCAGSKVNGPKYGVAKKASLVVVKAGTSSVDTNDALDKILQDVRAKKLQGKAIVNFSRCIEAPSAFNQKMIAHYVKELIREDVIFIVAAGNDDREEVLDGKEKAADVNSWPALMAGDGVPVINVGAVDNAGKNASFSQGGPLVHVMAPGVQVQCAANSYFYGTQKKDGTSFAAPAVAGLAAYLLAVGEHPELYQIGKVAENMKKLLMDMAYQRSPDGGQVAFNGQGAVCSRPRSAKFKRQDLGGEACSVVSSTSTIAPTPTSAPPKPQATTSNPPAATTAPPPPPPPPPAPKVISSLNEQVDAGTTACFPTGDFSTTAGTTYGFSFDVDPVMVVSIQTGTDEGYFQAKGPWTGTFLATADSSVSICGTGASGALSFKVTEEPTQPIKAPAGKEVFKLDEKATAGATSCFPTSGLDIQEGNYGFSYTTSDGVEIQIGDDSSGPKYYTGNKASGAGLMYIDFSGGSISICATNNGGSDAPLSLTITQ
ncbi:Subtilisin-like protease 2 [Colletotrichum orbiculare MAFF 240422]|uniref:Subtilisin-like protease 2 n=1 Tax=Colletotrichum orbiculare (strain 104-T / ATCC 96160 / CBS 514.97 / LARS 414 / MAFF 240422) TaxID=1213857 RepID=A0A484FLH6_COLOR|nr:Subtilisin-like protease 2 [Colletotrichum orbiculare MAFF 240422]